MSIGQNIAAAIFAVTVAGTPVYWVLDRQPPVEVFSTKVLTPTVMQGGDLLISYDFDRKRVCNTTVQRSLFDGANVEFDYVPDTRDAFGPIQHDTTVSKVQIPTGASPGPARFRSVVSYRCNPLHWWFPVIVVTADQSFEITEKPPA